MFDRGLIRMVYQPQASLKFEYQQVSMVYNKHMEFHAQQNYVTNQLDNQKEIFTYLP